MSTATARLAFVFLLCLFRLAHAWRPVGHYAVARECDVRHEEAGLYNLPDAWDSYDWTFSITDNFCRSHSVVRDGRNWMIPKPPLYHLSREPGATIKALAESDKIIHWSSDNQGCTKASALNTAKYFTGHNAADYPVHWEYFKGGSINNWNTQHKIKEEWADYAILVYLDKITFKSDGSIDTFWDTQVVGTVQPMPFDVNEINCPIIVLAQKMARKNRFILDEEDMNPEEDAPNTYRAVNSVGTVASLMQNLSEKVNKTVKKMNEERWEKLKKKAIKEGWISVDQQTNEIIDWGDLVLKFNESKVNFQSKQ